MLQGLESLCSGARLGALGVLGISDQPAACTFNKTLNDINGLRANHVLFNDNIIVIFVEIALLTLKLL